MYPSLPQGQIRPKLSSMPRQKSEATICLDVYKLVVERKRLQQELQKIEQRRHLINKRIEQLDSQIGDLDQQIQQLREPAATPASAAATQTPPQAEPKQQGSFNTLMLEY